MARLTDVKRKKEKKEARKRGNSDSYQANVVNPVLNELQPVLTQEQQNALRIGA